jgi:putative serine protease PepD
MLSSLEGAPMTTSPETPESAPIEASPIDPVQHPALAHPKPKRQAPVGVIAALAVGALVGGVSGAGVAIWATSSTAPAPAVANASPTTVTVNSPATVTPITAVAAKAAPSVVTIQVKGDSAAGTGSGIVLNSDGYVLTNAHVATLEGAAANPTISVQTYDGRLISATIVGVDPISDLAVLKLADATGLTPAEFADSSALNVGDSAIAIGAPLGLAGTVTDGIVSALNRSITIASSAVPAPSTGSDQAPNSQTPFDFWNFDLPGQNQSGGTASSGTISLTVIQTDAAINPGNSGGALLDREGKVIGINVAIASAGGSSGQSGSIGVGFAIPANFAQRIAQELIATGTATHGLLGASVTDVTEDATQADSKVVGASIVQLSDGSAAGAAGLKVGDVITGINGLPVTGKTDLTAQVRSLAAGSKVTLTYVREGKPASAEVTLGSLS